jgi:DNA repair ATPase RecN
MARLRIRTLKLKGITKDYDYSFKPGLNIIAGPISTGKTSILDFIDYCFGATSHPEHIEIQRKIRSVMLEVQLDGEALVIERPLFSAERKATIHECPLAALENKHNLKLVHARQIPGQESISSYLLDKLRLFNVLLKEAPTRKGSDVDIMSFRDIMWFCYLKHERLDNKQLLFEPLHMKNLKLHQVFDVIFKIHAGELAQLSLFIKNVEDALSSLDGEIRTLTDFLNERNIPTREKLDGQLEQLSASEGKLREHLAKITKTLRGESDITRQLRTELSKIDEGIAHLSAIKRDRDKLLKRLLPLRGQYSEDAKKLQFLQEARRILDPLGLTRCPSCLEMITHKDGKGQCSLCGSDMKAEPTESLDVSKEIKTIESKLRELNAFIQETDGELRQINTELTSRQQDAREVRNKLDEAMKEYVSPYIAERDATVGELNRIQQEMKDVGTQLELHNGIRERIEKKARMEEILNSKRTELESEGQKVKNRENVIYTVSQRFGHILQAVNFPKLENPRIDNRLVPFVRDMEYRKIGSSGAITLLSVSWFLSIFECALESQGSHPGFIMIDSPQKNIGLGASEQEPEFRDTKIVEGLYRHLLGKASEYGNDAQWIIVDNQPPDIADGFIAVRFSRRRDLPPYGLIDDEVE